MVSPLAKEGCERKYRGIIYIGECKTDNPICVTCWRKKKRLKLKLKKIKSAYLISAYTYEKNNDRNFV